MYGVKPSEYGPQTKPELFDLIIFEGALPTTLPSKPILAIAPPRTSALGEVTGTLTNPGIGSLDPDDPILRYVDLSTVHVAEAKKLETPAWAKTVIPGPGGAPLLYAGTRGDMAFPQLGVVTEPVLDALRIPYYIMETIDQAPEMIGGALVQAYNAKRPVAVLMKKAIF